MRSPLSKLCVRLARIEKSEFHICYTTFHGDNGKRLREMPIPIFDIEIDAQSCDLRSSGAVSVRREKIDTVLRGELRGYMMFQRS